MRHPISILMWTACGLAMADRAEAQVEFSITGPSPTVGKLAGGAGPAITEGDLLGPAGGTPALGPLPIPSLVHSGAADLGLAAGFEEVDAFSHGADALITQPDLPNCRVWFSVGDAARSVPRMLQPTVWSETMTVGFEEAGADVWVDHGLIGPLPAGPIGFMGPARHVGLIDGNGLASPVGSVYPGLGLEERFVEAGVDDLDALDGHHDVGGHPGTGYFSLSFASAAFYGLSGADILQSALNGAAPVVYIPANFLGLSAMDDVDALALWDDGDGFYEPYQEVVNWLPIWGQDADMVLFSVRPGSPVIGVADSIFGMPIEPGDVLVPPLMGGMPPGILIAAERLDLRTSAVVRANSSFADNLDALDIVAQPLFDCNANGVEDACEIANGTLPDVDQNGFADDCNPTPIFYCAPKTSSNGCVTTIGTNNPAANPVSGANNYFAIATEVKTFSNGILFFGINGADTIPFLGGTLCMTPPLGRTPIQNSGGSGFGLCDGSFSQVINDGGATNPNLDRGPGTQNWLQFWYRDPDNGPGQLGTALSDAAQVLFD